MAVSPLKILVIEREDKLAKKLTSLLREGGYLVPKPAGDFDEALDLVKRERPNLVLLDIGMNQLKEGTDLASLVEKEYGINFIFLTNEKEQALIKKKLADKAAILVKPLTRNKLYDFIEQTTPKQQGVIFLKEKKIVRKVELEKITHFKKDHVYMDVYTAAHKFMVRSSMPQLFEQLGNDPQFMQVNRSYGINLNHVDELHENSVIINGQKIPVSKKYRKVLEKELR